MHDVTKAVGWLFLFEPEVREQIQKRHNIRLPQKTLVGWRQRGLVRASLRWIDKSERSGWKARGPGYACRYSIRDFAEVQLVALLRYRLRLNLKEIERVLHALGRRRIQQIVTGESAEVLVFDPVLRTVRLETPDAINLDLLTNQYCLDLRPITHGNTEAVIAMRQSA